MSIDPGDVDQEPFTPGWIPDGWEIGEPVRITKCLNTFIIYNEVSAGSHEFPNLHLPEFYAWLEWWNDE